MTDFNLHGVDLFGDPIKPKNQGIVASRFTFPPFTILDAKQGDWQERKREWISLGIKSEEGRENGATFGGGLASTLKTVKNQEHQFLTQ